MTKELKDLKRYLKNRKVGVLGTHKFFSVAILLIDYESERYIVFEERSKKLKKQPGEICFPGGAIEDGEGPWECAKRETFEEIGIEEDKIFLLGENDRLISHAGIIIYNFMSTIKYEDFRKSSINVDEVERLILVPISWFKNNPAQDYLVDLIPKSRKDFPYMEILGKNEGYSWKQGLYNVPVFRCNEYYTFEDGLMTLNNDYIYIWGITGVMLKGVLKILKDWEA